MRHVFCMMGADACTGWLEGCLALDEKGFVKTGQDLTAEDLSGTAGRCPATRCCWRPPARASSPSGTCARGT